MLSKAEFRSQRNEDASKHPEDESITTAASGSSNKNSLVSSFTVDALHQRRRREIIEPST